MKLSSSLNHWVTTAILSSGIVLGTILPSEACMYSKGKSLEGLSFDTLKSSFNNLDIKQIGLIGAGALLLSGIASATFKSQSTVSEENDWEVSSFSIPVPPEALESSSTLEQEEEYTCVNSED